MKLLDAIRAQVWSIRATAMTVGLVVPLFVVFLAGCGSVGQNSESFYQNMPRRPINWREYLTD
jgi:hypothetical protein